MAGQIETWNAVMMSSTDEWYYCILEAVMSGSVSRLHYGNLS